MIEHILRVSIQKRGLVLMAVLAMAMLGVYSYQKLSIDAVPDITNVQVQINTRATGYSPVEAEQRVTFPIETIMAGLPNLQYTRSLSRYGRGLTPAGPPASSSGFNLLSRVRSARSAISADNWAMLRSLALRMTGVSRPRSVSTAMLTFSWPG